MSQDGGLTWDAPRAMWQSSEVHLCEPGVMRSPAGEPPCIVSAGFRLAEMDSLLAGAAPR